MKPKHETFNERYIVEPDVDKRTKAGKEKYNAFVKEMEEKGNSFKEEVTQFVIKRKSILIEMVQH